MECPAFTKEKQLLRLRALLYREGAVTKKQYAAHSGLSLAACAELLSETVCTGLAEEITLPAPSGGRPRHAFRLVPDYAHILCLYTDNRNVLNMGLSLRVYDLAGKVLQDKFCPLPEILPDDLTALVREMTERDPLICAAGIGLAGVTAPDGTIEYNSFHTLDGFNPTRAISDSLGLSVVCDNDMFFAAHGFYLKNDIGRPHALCVSYWPNGRCAGMGTVINGEVVVGSTKFAGEIVNLPYPSAPGGREDALSHMLRGEDTLEMMGTVAVCAITLINPDVLVISGAAARGVAPEDILAYCRRGIPEKHLPAVYVTEDFHEEYMLGLFARAREALPLKAMKNEE